MGAGRSSIGQQIDRKLEQSFEDPSYGNKLLEAQGLDPFRLASAAPMDDGVPPSAPTGVVLTPYLSALHVEWDTPSPYDHVYKAVVEITPSDTGVPATHEVVDGLGTTIGELSYVNHDVRVKFVDLWDLESEWSAIVTGLPNAGADYYIDLEEANQKGNLSGLIPSINTELLGGENFAENTVKAISLAQPDYPNLLPLSEVDFDPWPAGQVWPPADTDINGNAYVTAFFSNGNTGQVVDRNGLKWLQITRSSTSTSAHVWPFSRLSHRGTQGGEDYILSVFVQGNAGVRVRMVMDAYTDTTGATGIGLASTGVKTLVGEPGGERIFFKFKANASYPFIRIRLETTDVNTVSRWTKFQLEQAGGKIEPSPWTAGVMSTGVVNARMITAIDANIANVMIKNAAIRSAAIASLTADKLAAGTISAGSITVASLLTLATGGGLVAGKTRLDSGGLSLQPSTSYNTTAISNDGKISDTTSGRSAVAFYSDDINDWLGVVLRSDGDAGHNGLIALHATNAGTLTATTTGRVEVLSVSSGYGQVRLFYDAIAEHNLRAINDVIAGGDAMITGQVQAETDVIAKISGTTRYRSLREIPRQVDLGGTSVAGLATANWTHGLGAPPRILLMQYYSNSRWHSVMEDYDSYKGGYWWKVEATSTTVYLYNGTSGITFSVRGFAML